MTSNSIVTDPQTVANLSNDFFINLGQTQYSTPQKSTSNTLNDQGLNNFSPITEKNLLDIVKTLKTTKVAGADVIPGILLTHYKEELLKPKLN